MVHVMSIVDLVEELCLESNGVVWATAADRIFSRGDCGPVTWPEASCVKIWRIIIANVLQRLFEVCGCKMPYKC